MLKSNIDNDLYHINIVKCHVIPGVVLYLLKKYYKEPPVKHNINIIIVLFRHHRSLHPRQISLNTIIPQYYSCLLDADGIVRS